MDRRGRRQILSRLISTKKPRTQSGAFFAVASAAGASAAGGPLEADLPCGGDYPHRGCSPRSIPSAVLATICLLDGSGHSGRRLWLSDHRAEAAESVAPALILTLQHERRLGLPSRCERLLRGMFSRRDESDFMNAGTATILFAVVVGSLIALPAPVPKPAPIEIERPISQRSDGECSHQTWPHFSSSCIHSKNGIRLVENIRQVTDTH
jgi:hypothetical protein